MRHFLSKAIPPFDRVLLVESGSRQLCDNLLAFLYDEHPEMTIDLITCYAGTPARFRPEQGSVFRVSDYPGPAARKRFFREMSARHYNIVGIVCSAEPIMTKWKWMLAARLHAKVFILNENGDYFWLDRGHWSTIRHFLSFRAGLSGAGAVRTPARLIVFPFALLYLILFAAMVHLRRMLRTRKPITL